EYAGWRRDITAQWMRWNEFTGHLTRVLLKVDRGSMYHSLEVRVPLLDRQVIETAQRVHWESCLDLERGRGKLPLRESLARHVAFQTTKKRGFEVPMAEWLKGSLKPLVHDLLMSRDDILGVPFNRRVMHRLYREQQEGRASAWGLWILLSLALWEQRYAVQS